MNIGIITKNTFKTAWPATLESICIAGVMLVDTVMVSALGTEAIIAVGLTNQPKMLALTPFIALQAAVASLTARRRGQNDSLGACLLLRQVLFLTCVVTSGISILCVAFAEQIMLIAGSRAETNEMAVTYFSVVMGAIVFHTISLVINAAQRGCGNTRIAMRTSIVSNLVNLVLNYLLIQGRMGCPALGITGAALATVAGTVCAFFMSVATIMKKGEFLDIRAAGWKKGKEGYLRPLKKMALNTWVEQLCMRGGLVLYAMIVARMGTASFAAHQIGMNILSLCFSFGDGLSASAVSLIGRSLGAKETGRAIQYLRLIRKIGFLCSSMLSAVFILFGRDIYSAFTKDEQIIATGVILLYFVSAIVFMQIQQIISSGCLRAAGDTRYAAVISFVSVTLVRPALGALLTYTLGLGLFGAWVAVVIDQFTRTLCLGLRVNKGKWIRIEI